MPVTNPIVRSGAFCNLSGEAAKSFELIATEVRSTRGNRIFSEGELAEQVFILREGRIKISVTSRERKTIILRIAEGGQLLGLSAVLLGKEYEHPPKHLSHVGSSPFRRGSSSASS